MTSHLPCTWRAVCDACHPLTSMPAHHVMDSPAFHGHPQHAAICVKAGDGEGRPLLQAAARRPRLALHARQPAAPPQSISHVTGDGGTAGGSCGCAGGAAALQGTQALQLCGALPGAVPIVEQLAITDVEGGSSSRGGALCEDHAACAGCGKGGGWHSAQRCCASSAGAAVSRADQSISARIKH